jgi:acetyl esterase/lipase
MRDGGLLSARHVPAPPAGAPPPVGMDIGPGDGDLFFGAYAGAAGDLRDARLSPAFADPARFPANGATLLVACEFDRLAPEAAALAARLAAAGRAPAFERVAGVGHQWDTLAAEGTWAAQRRDDVYGRVVEVIKAANAAA